MTVMKVNNFYDLSTFASPVLGSTYKGLRLMGILSYENAIKLDNIEAKQKQVYPYLPEGTPRDHTQYTYYHFVRGGKSIILADYWIVPNSISEAGGEIYTIRLMNVNSTEVALIRDQLRLLDIEFTIE